MGGQPMAPVPRAFAPPPMGGGPPMMPGMQPPMGGMMPPTPAGALPEMASPVGGPPPPADPMALLAALKELVGTPLKQSEPIYRPGYKQPKRPNLPDIVSTAKRLYENNRQWRTLVYVTLMWVHQELTGSFEEDLTDRELGFKEEYISTRLSAERNLIISKFASLQPSFQKRHAAEELRGWAQRLEDFALWMRDEEHFQHSKGNRPLEFDEGTLLFDYGMLTKRHTFAPERTDCPILFRTIDPAQVYPVWGNDGLKAVYRVYRDDAEHLAEAYGDFSPSALKKIEDRVGKVGDTTELEVIEYWDTWYRSVSFGDEPLMGVTEHKYGDVPWTVQYGAYGDPMFTRSPSIGAANRFERTPDGWVSDSSTRNNERMRKSVPYLYFHLKNHEIMEAVNARLITAMKKDVNPPMIRMRTNDAAEKDLQALDTSPGGINEGMKGEEDLQPIPTYNTGYGDRLMAQLETDYRAISAPPQMAGRVETSNVSSVAQAGANDAGMHLISPLAKSMERALISEIDVVSRMLGNLGHIPKYKGEKAAPLIIPNRKARAGQPAGYEFDREVIEKVGSRVQVTFTKVDPRDWAALFAAGENGVMGGFILPREIRAIATGDHDWDTFFEEWQETNSLMEAQKLPEFQKINVMATILEKIKENDGRPDIQDGYKVMFQLWQQAMQPPQQPGIGGPPQGGPSMSNGGQQALPQGGQQGPFPGVPDQGGGQAINPGVPGQVSYPQVGAGPGTQGAPVGRPY